MTSFVKNGLTIIGLIIVAGLGYYLFMLNSSSELDSENLLSMNEAQVLNDQFLRELNSIKSIELADDLFIDARFRSFVDFTTPVQSLPIGRNNPFAPVE